MRPREAITQILVVSLGDPELRTSAQEALTEALRDATPDRLVSLLVATASAEQWTQRDKVARRLTKLGLEAVAYLTGALLEENVAARWSVAELLGQIGDSSAVEHLTQLLKDEDASIRDIVEQSLRAIEAADPRT